MGSMGLYIVGVYMLRTGADIQFNWHSCEDENTIEPQITRCSKTAMAALWKSLVCGVHDVDYWEFVEGWH